MLVVSFLENCQNHNKALGYGISRQSPGPHVEWQFERCPPAVLGIKTCIYLLWKHGPNVMRTFSTMKVMHGLRHMQFWYRRNRFRKVAFCCGRLRLMVLFGESILYVYIDGDFRKRQLPDFHIRNCAFEFAYHNHGHCQLCNVWSECLGVQVKSQYWNVPYRITERMSNTNKQITAFFTQFPEITINY